MTRCKIISVKENVIEIESIDDQELVDIIAEYSGSSEVVAAT